MNDKIRRTHLERNAVVYLRQSTMRQVRNNRESTARQYNLRQRAVELGWTSDAVQVVDEDLGQSGTSTRGREGFRRLAEDVAHGRVGAIFALEPSRFARSSADWHRLLDLCRLADVLIADENGVYAPRDPNDRLLLGLKGQMSDAEQYWMRLRLQGGKLSKARRGELYVQPPTGYQWDAAAKRLRLDPDEQAQRAIRLIFERFRIDGSVYGVMRYFARKGMRIPARDTATGEMRWAAPRHNSIRNLFHNPIYAGAYVYGRREERTALVDGQIRRRRVSRLPQEEWKVCIHDHHPAYITWEEYMANVDKLHENRSNYGSPEQRGAARDGAALLQGLVLCGKCGVRMGVRYCGQNRRVWYTCRSPNRCAGTCWSLPGARVDEAVGTLFLEAAQPPEIELSLAVAREAERQGEEVERQWRLRLDRVHYEAKLAERRYKAVDPDNRVVARTLEREWEETLLEVERTERDYQQVREREKVELDDADRARVLALAKDLPRVWSAPSTTNAQRKNLLRTLVTEVTLTPIDVPRRQTRIQVMWVTGAVNELAVDRPSCATIHAPSAEAVDCIRELVEAGMTTREIAADLNERGIKTSMGHAWTMRAVRRVRRNNGLQGPPASAPVPLRRNDGLLSTNGVAEQMGVTPHRVRYWVEKGWLIVKEGGGQGVPCWYELDDATLQRLETAKASGYGPRPRRRDPQGQHP